MLATGVTVGISKSPTNAYTAPSLQHGGVAQARPGEGGSGSSSAAGGGSSSAGHLNVQPTGDKQCCAVKGLRLRLPLPLLQLHRVSLHYCVFRNHGTNPTLTLTLTLTHTRCRSECPIMTSLGYNGWKCQIRCITGSTKASGTRRLQLETKIPLGFRGISVRPHSPLFRSLYAGPRRVTILQPMPVTQGSAAGSGRAIGSQKFFSTTRTCRRAVKRQGSSVKDS